MRLANAFCRFVEFASTASLDGPAEPPRLASAPLVEVLTLGFD